MSTIKDALQVLDPLAASMMSTVRTLMKIYLMVPVTTAMSERSFLRRLKMYLDLVFLVFMRICHHHHSLC